MHTSPLLACAACMQHPMQEAAHPYNMHAKSSMQLHAPTARPGRCVEGLCHQSVHSKAVSVRAAMLGILVKVVKACRQATAAGASK